MHSPPYCLSRKDTHFHFNTLEDFRELSKTFGSASFLKRERERERQILLVLVFCKYFSVLHLYLGELNIIELLITLE